MIIEIQILHSAKHSTILIVHTSHSQTENDPSTKFMSGTLPLAAHCSV